MVTEFLVNYMRAIHVEKTYPVPPHLKELKKTAYPLLFDSLNLGEFLMDIDRYGYDMLCNHIISISKIVNKEPIYLELQSNRYIVIVEEEFTTVEDYVFPVDILTIRTLDFLKALNMKKEFFESLSLNWARDAIKSVFLNIKKEPALYATNYQGLYASAVENGIVIRLVLSEEDIKSLSLSEYMSRLNINEYFFPKERLITDSQL